MFALAIVLAAAPVPKANEKLPPPTAEQYRTAQTNLKQIGLAIHNYESANSVLPNNSADATGRALLIWRVHILPFFDDGKLFAEFKLDEPWDSEANKKLIPKLPKVYAPVRAKAKPGETFLRGFTGPGTIFEAGKKLGIIAIADGTSNTGMVFEAAEATPWTKPDDLPFDMTKPVPKLGGQFDGVCHVLMGDGSVFVMRKDPDADLLKFLIQTNDGMVVDFRKLEVTK